MSRAHGILNRCIDFVRELLLPRPRFNIVPPAATFWITAFSKLLAEMLPFFLF